MTYESWRITFQSSEQAARSAFEDNLKLQKEVARLKYQLSLTTEDIEYLESKRWNH